MSRVLSAGWGPGDEVVVDRLLSGLEEWLAT
jgi:hypothetical protein